MRTPSVRKGRGLRLLGLCLVLLGICVFAWGLRYKLSLYDAPCTAVRHMPEAKLLSSRERSQAPLTDLREATKLGAPLLGCTLLLALFAWLEQPVLTVRKRAFEDTFSRPPFGPGFDPSCSNRPPPRLL